MFSVKVIITILFYFRSTYYFGFLLDPFVTAFAIGMITAGFVLLPVEEKTCKMKHLQMVYGLSKMTYWLFTYVWDFVWYLAVSVLTIIPFLVFKDPIYYKELPILVIVLLSYGLAIIPWIYLWSFLFSSPTTAYVWIYFLNFSSGSIFIIYDAMQNVNHDMVYSLVWMPLPMYFFVRSMLYLSMDKPLALIYHNQVLNPYWDLLPFIGSLLLQSCIYSSIIILIEASPFIINR